MKKVYGWHFTKDNKLGYGDGRKIVVGETHKVPGPARLCQQGLHASKCLLDALSYAPGNILHYVELSGEIIYGADKMVATHRTYLKELDTLEILKKFARLCALDVIHLWPEVPEVVVQFLKTGDISLAAEAARWATRWATGAAEAARWAAEAAAGAAEATAEATRWATSWAAGAAAGAAGATRAGLKMKQNKRLTAMVWRALNK